MTSTPPSTSSSSALVRVSRTAWTGTREGWSGTSHDARRRFLLRLLGATLLAAAAASISAFVLRDFAVDGALPGDAALTARIMDLLSIHSAVWLGAFTSSAMVTPLLVLAAVLWARRGRWERAVTAITAYIASKAIIFAGWNTWDRARPADVLNGELVPAGLSSYPSGHAVQTWTVYGLLILWWAAASDRAWERALAWTLLLVGSLVIGVGRVRISAHYPSDIIGGILIGALWLAGAAWAERAVGRPLSPSGGRREGGPDRTPAGTSRPRER